MREFPLQKPQTNARSPAQLQSLLAVTSQRRRLAAIELQK